LPPASTRCGRASMKIDAKGEYEVIDFVAFDDVF
jgi:hypothetical protein